MSGTGTVVVLFVVYIVVLGTWSVKQFASWAATRPVAGAPRVGPADTRDGGVESPERR